VCHGGARRGREKGGALQVRKWDLEGERRQSSAGEAEEEVAATKRWWKDGQMGGDVVVVWTKGHGSSNEPGGTRDQPWESRAEGVGGGVFVSSHDGRYVVVVVVVVEGLCQRR